MSAPQCWAYNKQRQRCEQHPVHEDEHRISVAWTDDECFDPADAPVPFVPTAPWPAHISGGVIKGEGILRTYNEAEGVFEDSIIEEDADLLGETGACFSCGCSSEDHPCEKHGCRNYVA